MQSNFKIRRHSICYCSVSFLGRKTNRHFNGNIILGTTYLVYMSYIAGVNLYFYRLTFQMSRYVAIDQYFKFNFSRFILAIRMHVEDYVYFHVRIAIYKIQVNVVMSILC